MGNPIGKAIGSEIMEEVLKPIFRTLSGDAAQLATKGKRIKGADLSFKQAFDNGSIFKTTNEIQHADALRIKRRIANNMEEYTLFKGSLTEAASTGNYTPLHGYLNQLELDDARQLQQNASRKDLPDLSANTRAGESPSFETPVDPIATGKANRMGTGGAVSNTDIANIGRTDAEALAATQAKGESIYGPGAHHHIVDQKFNGLVYNTTDAPKVIEWQKKLGGTRFGDNEYNISMVMDRKELPADINFRRSGKDDMAAQLSEATELKGRAAEVAQETPWVSNIDELNEEQRRLLTDLSKGDSEIGDELYFPAKLQDPASIGLPRGDKTGRGYKLPKNFPPDWPDAALAGQPITAEIKDKFWANRWKYNGLTTLNKWNKSTRANIKFNPKGQIVSSDHIDIVHEALNSEKFTLKRQIEAEVKSGKWRTRPPQERAKMLNEVQRISENIMLNTAIRRLELLKDKIRRSSFSKSTADFIIQDPYNIRKWVEDNPALAANLGWGKNTPSFEELIMDPGDISDDIRVVFATKIRKPADLLNFQQGFSSTVQTPQ